MTKPLSANDQLTQMSTYAQVLLCFPITGSTNKSDVIAALERGARTLTEAIPYLAGQVYIEKNENDPKSFGTFKLDVSSRNDKPMVRVKDVTNNVSSYPELAKAKVPMSMLDGKILTPVNGFPDSYDLAKKPAPALIVQANFISGGLLLTIAGLHNVMDGTGLGQVIQLFAAGCRGEQLPKAHVEAANFDRAHIIPSMGPHEKALGIPGHRFNASQGDDSQNDHSAAVSMTWACFRLSALNLVNIKAEASKDCSAESAVPWITTNDAASALIWRTICRAKFPHLDRSQNSNLMRTVTGRKRLNPPIPDAYIGNVVTGAGVSIPLEDLTSKLSLSAIAISIRKATKDIDDLYIRSLSQMFRSEPDKRLMGFSLDNPSHGLTLSSLADLPAATSDFGPSLGRSEYVRRPYMTPVDGLAYILPRDADGNLDIAISVRMDDMDRMREDETWMNYAEYIG